MADDRPFFPLYLEGRIIRIPPALERDTEGGYTAEYGLVLRLIVVIRHERQDDGGEAAGVLDFGDRSAGRDEAG